MAVVGKAGLLDDAALGGEEDVLVLAEGADAQDRVVAHVAERPAGEEVELGKPEALGMASDDPAQKLKAVKSVITNGVGRQMPVFGHRLDDTQIKVLVAYLRQISAAK